MSSAGRCGGGLDSDGLEHFLEPLGVSQLVVKEVGPVTVRGVREWVRGLYTLGGLVAEVGIYDN